jgi:hypothetical protein
MASFEQRFITHEGGRWRRVTRDLALLGWMAAVLWWWLVPGGRVRRALRQAQRTGVPMRVDDYAGGGA